MSHLDYFCTDNSSFDNPSTLQNENVAANLSEVQMNNLYQLTNHTGNTIAVLAVWASRDIVMVRVGSNVESYKFQPRLSL